MFHVGMNKFIFTDFNVLNAKYGMYKFFTRRFGRILLLIITIRTHELVILEIFLIISTPRYQPHRSKRHEQGRPSEKRRRLLSSRKYLGTLYCKIDDWMNDHWYLSLRIQWWQKMMSPNQSPRRQAICCRLASRAGYQTHRRNSLGTRTPYFSLASKTPTTFLGFSRN